jgi:dinuclear metal center YbgI/SA1388 family protein
MTKIADLILVLEKLAPPSLQESYDNAGLLTGKKEQLCSGVMCCLDVTEEVLEEAIARQCNLVVAHHPLIFSGLKRINGNNEVERSLIKAIKNDIAIYAIHTNLDNVIEGVNGKMANLLGLQNCKVLLPKENSLKKLVTYIPLAQLEQVQEALFKAGAGQIGHYSECSFSVTGNGTFKAGPEADPYVGEHGARHTEPEARLEVLIPTSLEQPILNALRAAHPYEEVAYDVVPLSNLHAGVGAGLVGELETPLKEADFLNRIRTVFNLPLVRHTAFTGYPVSKVALCGGAGSFLIKNALSVGAQVFITADLKYHDFFLADKKILLADIGHFESEQFTIDLLKSYLAEKFPNFAVLKTSVFTNPVNYLWQ